MRLVRLSTFDTAFLSLELQAAVTHVLVHAKQRRTMGVTSDEIGYITIARRKLKLFPNIFADTMLSCDMNSGINRPGAAAASCIMNDR